MKKGNKEFPPPEQSIDTPAEEPEEGIQRLRKEIKSFESRAARGGQGPLKEENLEPEILRREDELRALENTIRASKEISAHPKADAVEGPQESINRLRKEIKSFESRAARGGQGPLKEENLEPEILRREDEIRRHEASINSPKKDGTGPNNVLEVKPINNATEETRSDYLYKAPEQLLEREISREIANAKGFKDLSKVLEKLGGLQGSQQLYSAEHLNEIIEQVRKGEKNENDLTRTGGLREKVMSLVSQEKNKTPETPPLKDSVAIEPAVQVKNTSEQPTNAVNEGTPAEWRKKLRALLQKEKARALIKFAKDPWYTRDDKAEYLREYTAEKKRYNEMSDKDKDTYLHDFLTHRDREIYEQAKKLGIPETFLEATPTTVADSTVAKEGTKTKEHPIGKMEKFFRTIGEKYNKLSWKAKLKVIGGLLTAGVFTFWPSDLNVETGQHPTPIHKVVNAPSIPPPERTAVTAQTATYEIPPISVKASRGHGYEEMTMRVWNELNAKHLISPDNYPKGSDIHQLLATHSDSINETLRDIASRHHFLNADGTSVQINLGAHMSIGQDGNLHLFQAGQDIVDAPANAPTTSIYTPEGSTIPPEVSVQATTSPKETNVPTAPWKEETITRATIPVPTETMNVPNVLPTEQLHMATVDSSTPATPEIQTLKESPTVLNGQDMPENSASNQSTSSAEQSNPTPTPPIETVTIEHHAGATATLDASTSTEVHQTMPTVAVIGTPEHFITNRFGLAIQPTELHLYQSPDGKNIFAFGGAPEAQTKSIQDYLVANPKKVVFGTDDSGTYRLRYFLGPDGKLAFDRAERTRGFFGFGSSFVKAPGPDDLKSLIQ